MEFLGEHQLPLTSWGPPCTGPMGTVALEVLRSNPYLIVGEEFGVEFSQADQLALSLGVGGEDPQRLEAGLLFELAHNLNNGHSFLPRRKLIEATGHPARRVRRPAGALAWRPWPSRGEVVWEAVAGEDGGLSARPLRGGVLCGLARQGDEPVRSCCPPDDLDKLIARIQAGPGHHATHPSSGRRWSWQPAGR